MKGDYIAMGFFSKLISNQTASEQSTQQVIFNDPNTICQGASLSSSTFLDQFKRVFKACEKNCGRKGDLKLPEWSCQFGQSCGIESLSRQAFHIVSRFHAVDNSLFSRFHVQVQILWATLDNKFVLPSLASGLPFSSLF